MSTIGQCRRAVPCRHVLRCFGREQIGTADVQMSSNL